MVGNLRLRTLDLWSHYGLVLLPDFMVSKALIRAQLLFARCCHRQHLDNMELRFFQHLGALLYIMQWSVYNTKF